MTTPPAQCENVMLRRGLIALSSAYPAEFTADARDIVRGRLKAGHEILEESLRNTDLCRLRRQLHRALAANEALLPAMRKPERAAVIRAKIESLKGDIQRLDRFLEPYRRRAIDSERAATLVACEKIRQTSLDTLLEVFNSEEFARALTAYLAAVINTAVCGENVDDFTRNRTAMLTDGD